MIKRFTVMSAGENTEYFWIKDNDAKQYNMPERAVSINFAKQYRATEVCNYLNNEWENFLRNPT